MVLYPLPWGCSSLGRALEWHSRGKGFDPPHLHQKTGQGIFAPSCLSFCDRMRGIEPMSSPLTRSAKRDKGTVPKIRRLFLLLSFDVRCSPAALISCSSVFASILREVLTDSPGCDMVFLEADSSEMVCLAFARSPLVLGSASFFCSTNSFPSGAAFGDGSYFPRSFFQRDPPYRAGEIRALHG